MTYNGSQAIAGRSWSLTIGPQAPANVTATGSGTGGTLAAGSYFYKVTATVGGVESLASAEVSATTTGSTSSVTIAWGAVAGATSYKIYKGTSAGSESSYFTSTNATYTDTGTAGTAGTVPTSSGTLIGEITELPYERPEWQFDDTTNLQSANDEEYLPTIRKSNEFSLKLNYISSDAGQAACETAYQNATPNTFVLQATKTASQSTKGDSWQFSGYVLAFNLDAVQPGKKVGATIKIKSTGASVRTLGS